MDFLKSNLEYLIKEVLGMTVVEFAAEISVAVNTVYSILQQPENMKVSVLWHVAELAKCPIQSIFTTDLKAADWTPDEQSPNRSLTQLNSDIKDAEFELDLIRQEIELSNRILELRKRQLKTP